MSEQDVSLQAINKRQEAEIVKLNKRLDKFMAPIVLDAVFKPETIFDYLERNRTPENQDFHVRGEINQGGQLIFYISPDDKAGELAIFNQDEYDAYHSDIMDKYSRAIQGVAPTPPVSADSVHTDEPTHKILPILIKDDKGNEFLLEDFQQVLTMSLELEESTRPVSAKAIYEVRDATDDERYYPF